MNTSAQQRFTISIYGRKASGFSYLLSGDAGLVTTSGRGSDFGRSVRDPVGSVAQAIEAAMAFIPAGSLIAVHGVSGRLPIRCGTREQFAAAYEAPSALRHRDGLVSL